MRHYLPSLPPCPACLLTLIASMHTHHIVSLPCSSVSNTTLANLDAAMFLPWPLFCGDPRSRPFFEHSAMNLSPAGFFAFAPHSLLMGMMKIGGVGSPHHKLHRTDSRLSCPFRLLTDLSRPSLCFFFSTYLYAEVAIEIPPASELQRAVGISAGRANMSMRVFRIWYIPSEKHDAANPFLPTAPD